MKTGVKFRGVIQRRMTMVILSLWILLCLIVPLALALEGPVLTPPGGVTFNESGACTALGDPVEECLGRTGGIDFTYTDFDLSQSQVLYWGPIDTTAVGLAFDCAIDETGESMSLNLGQSDLANGMARWTGSTDVTVWNGVTWITDTVNTTFTLTASDLGGGIPLRSGTSLGLGNTAVITVAGDFAANLLMEAQYSGVLSPSLELFDGLHTRPEHENCAISRVEHGFFYEDDPITGLTAANDSPTLLGHPTTLTATTATGTNVTYTWDLGNFQNASGAIVSHFYPVGTYTAIVTASNNAGFLTETTTVIVNEPISGLSATNNGPMTLGTPTMLTATVVTGSDVSYSWAFGDGVFGSGAAVSHLYPSVGAYTARVTASNSINLIAATTNVIITDPNFYVYLPVMIRSR